MSQVGSSLPRVLAERYQLSEQLASGRLTSVWRGHDLVLGRDVIVKVLHPHLAANPALRARFHDQIINAARLTHPNIVALYDTGEQQGVDYLVMELVQGPTLRQVLAADGPLPPPRAAWIACEVAQALDYAHRAGVAHRNLTPSNILLAQDGSVKVADFAITAAGADDDPDRTGELLCPPAYLAPEVLAGAAPDGRADLYGLGACLYEMLTGRPPRPSRGLSMAGYGRRQLFAPRAVLPGVPRELDQVVRRAMSADPADRYPSAEAIAAALAPSAAEADGQPASLLSALFDQAPAEQEQLTPEPGFLRHEGRWLGLTLALVAMAAFLVVAGLMLARSMDLRLPDSGTQTTARPPASTAAAPTTPRRFAGALAFDPESMGGDGHENDDQAGLAIDQDSATAWRTQHYNRPALGGLKPGVGLVLGLDHALPVAGRELDLTLLSPGGGIEVYGAAGETYPTSFPDGWTRLAAARDVASRQQRLALEGQGSVRWYLVWFTSLPPAPDDPSRYQDGITEAVLRPRS